MTLKKAFVGVLVFCVVYVSCSQESLQPLQKIAIGKWIVDRNDRGWRFTLEITENLIKFVEDNDSSISYKFDATNIYFESNDNAFEYSYNMIDKNSFTVSTDGSLINFSLFDKNTFTMSFVNDDYYGNSIFTFRKIQTNQTNQKKSDSIIGNYIESKGEGLIESIEILDKTNVIMIDKLIGNSLPGKYEVTGTQLIITISGDSAVFTINQDGTLDGTTFGMTGHFIKE